ncbi:MAG TPA: hypothetical protein VM431_01265 [Phycisphaerae bacterium]|nr:hypothetical protein [Phycisphaerae bacterium]
MIIRYTTRRLAITLWLCLASVLALALVGGCLPLFTPGTPGTRPAGGTEGPDEPTVIVKTIEVVKEVLPDLLVIAGAAGVPLAGALGAFLQKMKSNRVLEDVVRSVQDAKAEVGVKTKAKIGKALGKQRPETAAAVKKIKAKLRTL